MDMGPKEIQLLNLEMALEDLDKIIDFIIHTGSESIPTINL